MRNLKARIARLEERHRPLGGTCVATGETLEEIEAAIAAFVAKNGPPGKIIRICIVR